MSTAVSCASCDAVQCPEVASEASSLYQFSSMVLHVAPGDTDFQPDSSPFWDSLPVWITRKYCGYCLQQETLTEIGGEWGHPKFSKPGFSNTWTVNFHMFKLVLEKAEEPEIKLSTSPGSLKKQESSRKTSTYALLTMPKPLTVWTTTNSGKFLKRWEYETTWPASWETYMQVRKQQLELDMEQQTDSKQGKEYIRAIYCHLAYLS